MKRLFLALVISTAITTNCDCLAGLIPGDTYVISPLAGNGTSLVTSLSAPPNTVPVLGTGHIVGTSLNGATITSSGEIVSNANGTETLTLTLTALGGAQLFAPAGPFGTFNQAVVGFGTGATANGGEISFQPILVPAIAPGKTSFAEIELFEPNGNSPSGPFRIFETDGFFSFATPGNSTELSFTVGVGLTSNTPVVSEVQIRITFEATPVPEPSSALLLLVAGALLPRRLRPIV